MKTALASLETGNAMADTGMAASASDAGVGTLCARDAVRGAGLNVRINTKDLAHDTRRQAYLDHAQTLEQEALAAEARVLKLVAGNL